MKNIVLILAYFGKFPSYFHLWLKTAGTNKEIDFLIYTDCDLKNYADITPSNVRFVTKTFSEMKDRFQSKFDFDIRMEKPYKLCDYKPVYGYVFQDDIKQYDYWGHLDLDLLFGNISAFLPQEDYDKTYYLGHLTIYRNYEENNMRFMQSGGLDYKDVFTTDFNCTFDEQRGMQKKFDHLDATVYDSNDFADIARRRLNFTLNSEICRKNYKYQIFYYDNGRVFRDYYDDGKIKTDEFNYIHFSHRDIPDKTNGSDTFYITRFGFIEKKGASTLEIIKKLNAPTPIQNIFCSINTQIIRRVKRVINAIKTGYGIANL